MPMEYLFLIILLVFMIGMMFFQTRKAKQQQEERKNFWSNLAPGTEIVTIGGLIGKVVEVDEPYEEIVTAKAPCCASRSVRSTASMCAPPM